jgi:tetratricopeptide (TPR) repeat protein
LAAGDLTNASFALFNLGDIEAGGGNDEAARSYFEQALAIGTAPNVNARGLAIGTSMDRIGEIELRAGNLDAAARNFQEALAALETANETLLSAHVEANLLLVAGDRARLRGDNAAARQNYEAALVIFEPAPQPYNHGSRDYIAFVHQRLTLLEGPKQQDGSAVAATSEPLGLSAASPAAPSLAVEASAPRAKRRWWPWGARRS